MKAFFALAAAAVMSVGMAWAAPKAEWIPADAELRGAILRAPESQATMVEKVWKAEADKVNLQTEPENPDALLASLPEEARPLLKALGFKKQLSDIKVPSIVYGVLSDYKAPGSKQASGPVALISLENPTLDIAALDKALKELCAEDDDMKVVRNGAWRVLKETDGEDEDEEPGLAYRPLPGGLQIAFTMAPDALTALMQGKIAMSKPDDPSLKKLFALPKNCAVAGSVMLNDLSQVLKKALKDAGPDAEMQVTSMAPWAMNTHALALKSYITADKLSLTLAARTNDAATAAVVRDQLIMLKGLLQMGVAQQAPSGQFSATTAAIAAITCEAKGNVAMLSLSLTPAQAVAVAKELQNASEGAQAAGRGGIGAPALPDPKSGKEEQDMSDEELMKVLNEQ